MTLGQSHFSWDDGAPIHIPLGGSCNDPRGGCFTVQDDTRKSCGQRLKRIEGQVRGLAKMVEDDRYCIDIITQISAVQAALRKVEEAVLHDHVAHCVEGAIASGDPDQQRRKVAELIQVLGRASR